MSLYKIIIFYVIYTIRPYFLIFIKYIHTFQYIYNTPILYNMYTIYLYWTYRNVGELLHISDGSSNATVTLNFIVFGSFEVAEFMEEVLSW